MSPMAQTLSAVSMVMGLSLHGTIVSVSAREVPATSLVHDDEIQ